MSLLPSSALVAVAQVLGFGAKKYAPNNWRKVDRRSRYLDATLRHLAAYNQGEDCDPESGISHLAHAACSCLFLLACELEDHGEDDRHTTIARKEIEEQERQEHEAYQDLFGC